MKICIVTTVHPRNDSRIFHKQSQVLLNEMHEVFLVVADGLGNAKNGGISIIDVGKPPSRFFRLFCTQAKARKFINHINPDVVHFHDPEFLASVLLFRKKVKFIIYDIHEDLPKQVMNKGWLPKWSRYLISFLVKSIERASFNFIDYFIAATPQIARRFPLKKTVVVRNYPEIDKLAFRSHPAIDFKHEKLKLCYVGSITRERGIFQTLDALSLITEKVEFHLAGPIQDEDTHCEIKNHPAWAKVIYHGVLEREKVFELYSNSHCGIVTLHPTPSYIEAIPIKLFEYMASGLAIIASDFDFFKDIVQKESIGVCVNPLSPCEIAQAIREIVTHHQIIIRARINGPLLINQNFNWENEAKTLRQLYKELNKKTVT